MTTPTHPDHLTAEQRVLVEQVSHNPKAESAIRRRAEALLLLDEGLPVDAVSKEVALNRRSLRNLQLRHHLGGVRAALLGLRPALQRPLLLALHPLRGFAV